jgi:hypothetical protein
MGLARGAVLFGFVIAGWKLDIPAYVSAESAESPRCVARPND